MSKKYYTYILTHERNHIFYVGVTNNMERRMHEHKAATFGTHVGHYNIKKLVYFEEHSDIRIAIRREKTIKKWKKAWKKNLITERNPDWMDLSLDWDLSKYNKN
ncbi:GIY-YIG nuclease family protein [Oceanihabitans sp. 2_MG-2023]|uniref:GIY-YIG nuclease family protein n=1 Tax=Oceanihabitans sp. 2_MG-2023 TaxID=3062661 RepID=UPI0026E41911|nr:GIY-YIG nuclease family protein [Oceanihabitans sp. 2_MG-2023]MDO6596088.1 GIY-YIG nuclease family protein [Oceanihabitans sp. 2_MG-2023]